MLPNGKKNFVTLHFIDLNAMITCMTPKQSFVLYDLVCLFTFHMYTLSLVPLLVCTIEPYCKACQWDGQRYPMPLN